MRRRSSSVFTCNECNRAFYEKFDFYEHWNIHSKETPFMCATCSKCFSLTEDYIKHYKADHLKPKGLNKSNKDNLEKGGILNSVKENSDPHMCKECSKVFINSEDLENHLKEHSQTLPKTINSSGVEKSKSHKCPWCKEEFRSYNKFYEHKKKSHNFNCENCNGRFYTKEKLKNHPCAMLIDGESFKCSCFQEFTTVAAFKDHIKTRPFSCCLCSMLFNKFTSLVRHIRTHTKQKPFLCKDCGRRFSQSTHLRNHSYIHLGTNAVKCDECKFSCKTMSGLLKHKKRHKKDFEKSVVLVDGKAKIKYPCPICGKQFAFEKSKKTHIKVEHDGNALCNECGKIFDSASKLRGHYKACHDKPSMCNLCGKIFASGPLLRAHTRTHSSGEFTCDLCDKKFTLKSYLNQHLRTHNTEKQFSCNKCGKLFKVSLSLKYHRNICPA